MKLYLFNTTLTCPHEALFTFLIFIVGTQLGATPFQLMILACMKPITALFSFFASSLLDGHPQRVRRFLILNLLAGCLPCFLFPFVDAVWFYILSYALVKISERAAIPAWMEYLKKSEEKQNLSKAVSIGTSIEYAMIILFPTLMAFCMDRDPNIWRWFYCTIAGIKLSSILLIVCMKIDTKPAKSRRFINPLYRGWNILKTKPRFRHYLLIYFLGGAGLIGIQPILPTFFKQELHLSYTELALAFSFCKGLSFIATSSLWAKLVNRTTLYVVNAWMNVFSCLFIGLLLASYTSTSMLFPAYIFYGMMQAGTSLSKNLSGPVFSDDEDSTFYSSMNLALVGIRGMICPYLGYLLFTETNATTVFCFAFLLCFIGIPYALWADRAQEKETVFPIS